MARSIVWQERRRVEGDAWGCQESSAMWQRKGQRTLNHWGMMEAGLKMVRSIVR